MAFCDYHNCDHCGNSKTFYDANVWDESAVSAGFKSGLWGAYDMACLCHTCAKTHKVVIVAKTPEEMAHIGKSLEKCDSADSCSEAK